MNKLAQMALVASALTFAACNNEMDGHDAHDHDGHDHTVGEQVDAALDSLEQAGDSIGAIGAEIKDGVKAGIERAKEEVTEASKAAAQDVKDAAKKVSREVSEAAEDVKNDLKK
ncbi:hypothetical protein [Parapedobacter sp.]